MENSKPAVAAFDRIAAAPLTETLVARISSPPPSTYYEMQPLLQRLHRECIALLSAFNVEAKISKDKIPSIPLDHFDLLTAQEVVGRHFDALAGLMTPKLAKTALPALKDRQRKVMGSIGYFSVMKERYDVTVTAGVAGALIAVGEMPPKIGPVIKAVMDSVRVSEESLSDDPSTFLLTSTPPIKHVERRSPSAINRETSR